MKAEVEIAALKAREAKLEEVVREIKYEFGYSIPSE